VSARAKGKSDVGARSAALPDAAARARAASDFDTNLVIVAARERARRDFSSSGS
jgi:hypothetical protein